MFSLALAASFLHDDALVLDLVGLRGIVRVVLSQGVHDWDWLKLCILTLSKGWTTSDGILRSLESKARHLTILNGKLAWLHLSAVANLR